MGLTKEYEYTDNDGDTLTIDENDCDDKAIAWVSDMSSSGFNVTAENSVPLALNVLGYDRPDLERGECATRVGGYFAQGAVIRDQIERDELMATAASALKSIDFYDQGVAARRAEEAERQKRVEAKEAARRKLLDLTDEVSTRGVNPLRADALQIAVADYKKAIEAEKQYAKAF